jgi:hypothetical protein
MNAIALTTERAGQRPTFAIVGMLIWLVLFAGWAIGGIHLSTIELLFTLAPLVIVALGQA